MGSCASIPQPLVINDVTTLRQHIAHCKQTYAYGHLKNEFREKKIIDTNDILTTGVGPFNVFASMVTGDTPNKVDQSLLGKHTDKFMLCHNRPINDEKWDDHTFDGGSMAGPDENGPGHVFITTKDLHVDKFNVLPIVLMKNITFLRELLEAALEYTSNRGWSNPGFYFHCWPLNSVQSLHLHVINRDRLGHMFYKKRHANLSIYDAINMLEYPFNHKGTS
jgi:hypothetical protein